MHVCLCVCLSLHLSPSLYLSLRLPACACSLSLSRSSALSVARPHADTILYVSALLYSPSLSLLRFILHSTYLSPHPSLVHAHPCSLTFHFLLLFLIPLSFFLLLSLPRSLPRHFRTYAHTPYITGVLGPRSLRHVAWCCGSACSCVCVPLLFCHVQGDSLFEVVYYTHTKVGYGYMYIYVHYVYICTYIFTHIHCPSLHMNFTCIYSNSLCRLLFIQQPHSVYEFYLGAWDIKGARGGRGGGRDGDRRAIIGS